MACSEGWSIPGSCTLAPEEKISSNVGTRLNLRGFHVAVKQMTFGVLGGRSLGVLATLRPGEGHLGVLGTAWERGNTECNDRGLVQSN